MLISRGRSFGSAREDGRPPLRVGIRGHQAARLVIAEQPRALARAQRLAVDRRCGRTRVTLSAGEEITAPLTETRPGGDPGLRLAPRGKPARAITLAMRSPCLSWVRFFGHEHALWHCPRSCNSLSRRPAPPAARGEVPVGCVIVRDGEVVARAGNRTLADKDPTAHAELLAIRAGGGRARLASGLPTAISM